MKIRIVKTGSKAEVLQVVRYDNGKRIVLKHIGSAHNEEQLDSLLLDNGLKMPQVKQFFLLTKIQKSNFSILKIINL